MSGKGPDFSENSLIGAFLIIGSGAASIVGIASIFWHDKFVVLAIVAGSGWTLSVGLLVINGILRAKINKDFPLLKGELEETKIQASEWSGTANNVAESMRVALEIIQTREPIPRTLPGRVPSRRSRAQSGAAQEEGGNQ
ncbi:hypothetical protein [Asticcacaulis taihuensis]|uniref:hypothetical protein n=1 Tax=Asticcacaulis taihuensis TaxID=260084 RepID=UPI0011133288|nr:hypothetical protein [Asticcacaulis taihuensis]